LFGGSVPYLLRKKGGFYVLIGEVYVHGIMFGEAMELMAEGKLMSHKPRWICII
jgi:hypothetical protein